MNLATRIRRAAGVLFARQYEAAGASPRWPVSAIMPSQPSAALAARAIVSRKAAWLAANAPVASSICHTFCTSLIGDGPSAQSGHPNRAMRRALETIWGRFYKKADIEGGDLVSVLNRVVRALVVDGEGFVRLLTVGRGELRLQLLPASQIDSSISRELPGGSTIVQGVERGPNGERLAYWVLPASPDGPLPAMIGPAVRVDAADICHVYEPQFPGQVRGMSWLHSVATRLLELDSTEDAGIMKAKTSCLLAGFIRSLEGGPGDDLTPDAELSLEPGVLRRLRMGEDISFSPTSDMEGLNGFLVHLARSIAAGVGAPHELISGDLSNVNYSSAKLGLEGFRRRVKALRASVLVSRLLDPVWQRLITLEVLTGRLSAPGFEADPEPYFDASFLWPEFTSLDPMKETQADVDALNAGLRSRQEIIAARGRDPDEVTAELAADSFRPRVGARPERHHQCRLHEMLLTRELSACAGNPRGHRLDRPPSTPKGPLDRGGDRHQRPGAAPRPARRVPGGARSERGSTSLDRAVPACLTPTARTASAASSARSTRTRGGLRGDRRHPILVRGRRSPRWSRTSAPASSRTCRPATSSTNGAKAPMAGPPHQDRNEMADQRRRASSRCGADPNARTRSHTSASASDPVAGRAAVNRSIRDLCTRAGIPQHVTDELIDNGATIEAARGVVLDQLVTRGRVHIMTAHNAETIDNPQVFVRAAGEALHHRSAPAIQPTSPQARQFIGMRIPGHRARMPAPSRRERDRARRAGAGHPCTTHHLGLPADPGRHRGAHIAGELCGGTLRHPPART